MKKNNKKSKKELILISVLLAIILIASLAMSAVSSISGKMSYKWTTDTGTTITTTATATGATQVPLSSVVCGTTWCTRAPKGWPRGVTWPPRDQTGNCELCSTTLRANKVTAANNDIVIILGGIKTCPLPSDPWCISCSAYGWNSTWIPQTVRMSSCPYP